jgi:acetyltransferase-like isoleucine patch superfamily enzyme
MIPGRKLRGDWYPGVIPRNVLIDPTAYIGSSYNFARFRSGHRVGASIGKGAMLDASVLDVGRNGKIIIEEYAMVTQAYIICDSELTIGAYSLIAWNAVLMDNYRTRADFHRPRTDDTALVTGRCGKGDESSAAARPIRLGRNTWIGFEACILPGVKIGEGSIVAARAVVANDVPPFVIVAGNPARIVRELPAERL